MFVVLSWAGYVDIDFSGFKSVTAYQSRVAARPKVLEAMKAEGLA
jgi:glutathione S-transferase